jgi:RNA polymerase sigma-70 factor (ECF subfamily)
MANSLSGNKKGWTAVLQISQSGAAGNTKVPEIARRERFEQTVLPHLDAAYNLARWLTRNDQDAQDVTQESFLRAFRFFDGYQGGNMRAWLLTIVRNTCYTWLHQNRAPGSDEVFDEEIHSAEFSGGASPEIQVLASADKETLRRAVEELPDVFREVLVLREIEGMSYKEIADVASVSIGTVMSRLARARTRLRQSLGAALGKES